MNARDYLTVAFNIFYVFDHAGTGSARCCGFGKNFAFLSVIPLPLPDNDDLHG
jgi:hypothetical protein